MKCPRLFATVLIGCAVCSAGCKTLSPPEWTKGWMGEDKPKVEESKFSRPARLAVVWSPAVLNSPGKKPTRGFGGRIYFYDAGNNAVPVEGQLVVYGYNDSTPNSNSKSPDRKYAFTPEQFTSHFSPTDLGASYSVWIPWDEVGGDQMEVSLLPVFTAASGQLVVGQSSKNLLPGPATVNTATQIEQHLVPAGQMARQQAAGGYGVQQASFQEPSPGMSIQQPAMALSETSIRVPYSLSQRMAQAGPQQTIVLPAQPRAAESAAPGNAQRYYAPVSAATASWTRAPGVVAPPTSPTNQPLARFVRSARPAPSSPGLPPTAGHLPTQPFLGAQPSALPSSPGPVPQTGFPAAWSGASQMR